MEKLFSHPVYRQINYRDDYLSEKKFGKKNWANTYGIAKTNLIHFCCIISRIWLIENYVSSEI